MACLFCGIVRAQKTNNEASSELDEYMATGMEISGVRAPYYDDEGNLQAQLYGGHVKMLEGRKAEVTNLRVDVYDHGAIVMTVYAPHCFTKAVEKGKQEILSVESDGDVLIEMDQMTIYGRGFRFSSDNNRFEILSNSKVLVKESARNAKGLKL